MKPLTNFLLAVAALVTALTALIRATEEPAAQATYTELRKAVAQLSHDVRATHDDVEVLWTRVTAPMEATAICEPEAALSPLVQPTSDTFSEIMSTPARPASTATRAPSPKPARVEPPSFQFLKAREKF